MLASDGILTEQLFAHKIHHSFKTDGDINKVIRKTKLKEFFRLARTISKPELLLIQFRIHVATFM